MKFRAIAVTKLGFKLWEDQDPKEGLKQIFRMKEDVKSEKEIKEFLEPLLNASMDYSKPLWEFYFQEDYSPTESAIMIRMHHCWADAGGIVGLFSCLNDEDHKLNLHKDFPKPNIFLEYFCILFGPIYSVYLLGVNAKKGTDEQAMKINDLAKRDDHKTKLHMANKRLSFEALKKCFKRFESKPTFNDYLMGALSVSMDKWYKSYGIQGSEKLKVVNSINMRGLPKNIDEVDMFNDTIGKL